VADEILWTVKDPLADGDTDREGGALIINRAGRCGALRDVRAIQLLATAIARDGLANVGTLRII